MNRTEKAELIETLQSTFNASTTVVVAHQVGMTVAESGDLRQKMREAGAGFKVTKNRIAKLALKGTRYEDLDSIFTGPTVVGTSEDPVAAAKTLVDYAKGNPKNHHCWWQHGRENSRQSWRRSIGENAFS